MTLISENQLLSMTGRAGKGIYNHPTEKPLEIMKRLVEMLTLKVVQSLTLLPVVVQQRSPVKNSAETISALRKNRNILTLFTNA
jgi:hypothetical protein